MDKMVIQKIYPSSEELSSICSKVRCPQENCEAVFRSSSNLNMHLIKHHKISNSGLTAKKTLCQYFCPMPACVYHKGSEKYFTRLKYLKQHFLKVHAEKIFPCKKCDKKFSTETFRTMHMKTCGETFHCLCGFCFTSSEAILTHCKRKGKNHQLVNKNKEQIKNVSVNSVKGRNSNGKKSERFICPKISKDLSFPVHYIAAVALSELSTLCNISRVADKSIQTEIWDSDSNKESFVKYEKKKHSQQTQTLSGRNKKLKISTQTQTTNEYLKLKTKSCSKVLCKKKKKSMETQTKEHTRNCDDFNLNSPIKNENFIFINKCEKESKESNYEKMKENQEVVDTDKEKATKWLWDMVSPSTNKTSDFDLQYANALPKPNQSQYLQQQDNHGSQMFDLNKLCNIETQTEIDSFLTECNEDTVFTLCSTTETQTTDDFDSLLYSNMCTQTCEEVDQLFNFNFVHIETQTTWPDLNDQYD